MIGLHFLFLTLLLLLAQESVAHDTLLPANVSSSLRHRRLFNVDYTQVIVTRTNFGTVPIFDSTNSAGTTTILQVTTSQVGGSLYFCEHTFTFTSGTPTLQASLKLGSLFTDINDGDVRVSVTTSGTRALIQNTGSAAPVDSFFMATQTSTTGSGEASNIYCIRYLNPPLTPTPTVDGTISMQSVAVSSIPIGTEADVALYKSQTQVPAGATVTCTLSSCTHSAIHYFFITFGSIPLVEYPGPGVATASTNCDVQLSVKNTNNSPQDAYILMYLSSGTTTATLTCSDGTTASSSSSSCFSGDSTVLVEGRGTLQMKDLQVGDKVLVEAKEHNPVYQAVYAFGHYNPTSFTDYLRIHTNKQYPPLEISPAHLVYLAGEDQPVRADAIQPGHRLLQVQVVGPTKTVVVTKVDKVRGQGLFMPLTKSASIVVNGIKASTYVSISDDAPEIADRFHPHDLLHYYLAPYRMLCLGISSKLCQNDKNEDGIAYWLVLGRYVARKGNEWQPIFQSLGLAVVTIFMAIGVGLEVCIAHLVPCCCVLFVFLVLQRIVVFRGNDRVIKRVKME